MFDFPHLQNLDNSTAKLPLDEDETSLDSTSDSGRGGSDLESAAHKGKQPHLYS